MLSSLPIFPSPYSLLYVPIKGVKGASIITNVPPVSSWKAELREKKKADTTTSPSGCRSRVAAALPANWFHSLAVSRPFEIPF